MRVFGLTITREKAAGTLSPVDNRGGWWPIIREAVTGAWQRNEEIQVDTSLSNATLFRCVTLIASDIAKMRIKLVQLEKDGVWTEIESPAFSPVLRKPNRYQNRIQFVVQWMLSKLLHGNTYVLKVRDARGVVTALYVLDPIRVKPLVAEDGAVYYQLNRDPLSGLGLDTVTVPASEIIHDRINTVFHPLVGLSPIYACGLAAMQGLEIQRNSTKFFRNGSKPGGVLTAPGAISNDTAARLKEHWDSNYTGENIGKVAVLGDGLKYEAMAVNAHDAQLIDQLKWSSETVCSSFGVPAYMAGVGAAPLNNNVEALQQQYYTQSLQFHIESMELCLDEGLGLDTRKEGGAVYGVEFDLDDLLRMDTATQVKTLSEGVLGGLFMPDEGRKRLGLRPVPGGDTVYLQQQNYSLAALAKRDAAADPFGKTQPAPAASPAPANDDTELQAARALIAFQKGLAHVRR